jgi:hypothetical protein
MSILDSKKKILLPASGGLACGNEGPMIHYLCHGRKTYEEYLHSQVVAQVIPTIISTKRRKR